MRKNDETPSRAGVKNIILLGFVSFFADVSSEMVYPLIPLYLTAAFGATPALIGVIEGLAESLASLLKVFSGYVSDKYHRKKPLAFCGYAMGIFYKIALLVAGSWFGILGARLLDRFGKGIRTAPRDVMISESAAQGQAGCAFGLHKALDMAGSAVGILTAFLLVGGLSQNSYQTIFAVSILPLVVALVLFGFIHEKRGERVAVSREPFWKNVRGLNRELKLFLAVSFLFTLGNSSNAFLLLRAGDLGVSEQNVILLYLAYNIIASLFAIPCGKLSDKVGRKKLLVGGYLLFSAVYLGFALVHGQTGLVIIFVLYGLYTAMTSGVERAFISEIAPPHLKGTMLGLHATLVGIALLPASAIAGVLWNAAGVAAPFLFGAVLSCVAALLLGFGLKGKAEDVPQ